MAVDVRSDDLHHFPQHVQPPTGRVQALAAGQQLSVYRTGGDGQ